MTEETRHSPVNGDGTPAPDSEQTSETVSGSAIASAFGESPPPQASTVVSSKPKLKRNRIVLSCQPCHKRKQQCDRGHPCQRCVGRGAPTLCTYEQPKEHGNPKSIEKSPTRDLSDRINNLEGLVTNTLSSLDPAALAGLDALVQLLQASITVAAPLTSSNSGGAELSRANDHAVQVAAAALGQLSQQTAAETAPSSSTPAFGPIADILHHIRTGPAGINIMSSDLPTHFPNHKITDFLLNHYFEVSSVHWLWPALHRPCFESYYRTFSSASLPPSIEFTALLATTCALSLQFLPESDQDAVTFAEYPEGRHVMRQRLYEFARSVLISATHPPISSIERVQALLLFALYQWNDGNAGECYYIATIAIRMAHTLAMNRDGQTTWHMRPEDAEIRRRIWWSLFILDRFHCLEFRRPYIIFDQHTDVALPLNLDQTDILDSATDLRGKPLDEPTDSLFHLLQCQFAQMMGRMWDQCLSITLPTYRAVIDFDVQIRKFELDLPAAFRYQSAQSAMARPYIHFQSQMMTMQVYHARAALLRPFLFIRSEKTGESDGQADDTPDPDGKLYTFHVHAKTMCLIFCKRLLSILSLFQSQVLRAQLRWTSFVLHAYEAALMLAVAIIMDPHNPQNEELEEWIELAQSILKDLGTYSTLSSNALEHIEVIRKRTAYVLSVTGPPTEPANYCTAANPFLTDPALQRIERATRVLSQPQPSMADLMGHELASDTFWSTLRPGVFAGHFPGIESLSGPINPQNLEHFLDSCLSMQSRLPPIFTF